jgi:hypothetical protein
MNVLKNNLFISVFLLAAFFAFGGEADAAVLRMKPPQAEVTVGNIVSVQVTVDTSGKVINNAESVIQFPTDLLEVVSINKTSSIFSLWVENPSFSNASGQATFNGGVPNPGFQGSNGTIVSIVFRAKKAGTASVLFLNSAVRENDGLGTDILTATAPATITIRTAVPTPTPSTVPAAPVSGSNDLLAKTTSSTHPDQTKWYGGSRVVLDWTNAQGVSAVRLGYDTNAEGTPGVLYSDPISHKELQLKDGIWYFHVQEKGPSGWGPIATFRIQIDTTPPAPVVLKFPNGTTTSTSTIAVDFETTDALSGVDRYLLSVDGTETIVSTGEVHSVYALPAGGAGAHTLTVTAFDKASNSVSAEQQFTTIGVPVESTPAWDSLAWLIANYLSLLLLLLVALAAIVFMAWYLYHRFHTFRRRIVNKEERMRILVHRQFNELKSAIADEVTALEHIKSKRTLTVEEERLINRLQKLIDESENTIEKELESVLKK